MSVTVTTGDQEIGDPNIRTVRPDENRIVVDTTVEDAMDRPVPPAPVNAAPMIEEAPSVVEPEPEPVPTMVEEELEASYVPPAPLPSKPKRKGPAPPPPRPKHRQPPPVDNNVFSAIDDNPAFARAMRSTLPKGAAPVESMSESDYSGSQVEEPEEPAAPHRHHSRMEEEEEEASEADAHSEDAGSGEGWPQDDKELSRDAESGSTVSSKDEEASREDEYIDKMKIIEEIKGYAKMGILPPQPPALSMPKRLLVKIRDYMSSKADEMMGIGMLGTAWVQIVGLVEKLNGQHDPFAKIFGMGLKLSGAKEAVHDKIHLYEAVFKHIYAKLPKSQEANPWIQFGLVTLQIFAEVHVNNLRAEMEAEAREMARNPRTRQDAEAVRERFEERERQRQEEAAAETEETPAVRRTPAPPQPTMKPPPGEAEMMETDVDEEEAEEKVDSKIDMKQPPPKEDTKIGHAVPVEEEEEEEQSEEEAAEEDAEGEEDEDDVVVTLPAPKRRGKKSTDDL